jgi:predicted ferric reductase
MKRALFVLAYFVTPSIPASIYMRVFGGGFDPYSLSVMLGVVSFVFICNQFILASRPGFAVSALGVKGLVAFHSVMPLFIIALATAHRALKALAGFSLDTQQALLGSIAWWLFLAAILSAVLLLAPATLPLISYIKGFREWLSGKLGLNYKTSRLFHNLTVLAGLIVLVHMLLASSSSFLANPLGAAWLLGWMLLSLGLYARYRLRGRKG